MNKIHAELPYREFEIPTDMETVQICHKSGKLPISGVCNRDLHGNAIYMEYFSQGSQRNL